MNKTENDMSHETTSALATKNQTPDWLPDTTVGNLLRKQHEQIARALPGKGGCTADRYLRVALTTINKNPKLGQCTPASLAACLMDCASLGIEPDGRRAHLIPFEDKKNNRTLCQLIVDYKGLVELVRRSGDVIDVQADVVCANDTFDYQQGSDKYLHHKIPLTGTRGDIIAAYSFVKLKNGEESFEIMRKEEVDAVRKRSRAGNSGPWVTDYSEMAKKTVFRRHSKWLPFSAEMRDAIEKDDDQYELEQRFNAAKPARVVTERPKMFAKQEALPEPDERADEEMPAEETEIVGAE